MRSDWDELKISEAEIERVLETGIVFGWAIALTRVAILRQSQYWQSFLSTQSTFLFLNLLFFFPINLIIYRKLSLLDNNATGLITVSIATFILSFISMIVCNYYLWQKAKKLKLISKLLTKVERYNQLISNFSFIANVSFLDKTNSNNSLSVTEFKKALNLTKSSLLKSIELESFIYRHRRKSDYRQNTFGDRISTSSNDRLLANLEDDLATWSTLEIDSTQHRHLLDEAIDLGLSVHREVRQNRALKELDRDR